MTAAASELGASKPGRQADKPILEHGLSLLSMRQRFNLLLQRTTAPLRPSLFLTARKTPRATIWGNGFFCQSFDIGPCARNGFRTRKDTSTARPSLQGSIAAVDYSTDLKGALLALPVSLLNLLLLYHPPYSTFDCLLVFLFINIFKGKATNNISVLAQYTEGQ